MSSFFKLSNEHEVAGVQDPLERFCVPSVPLQHQERGARRIVLFRSRQAEVPWALTYGVEHHFQDPSYTYAEAKFVLKRMPKHCF